MSAEIIGPAATTATQVASESASASRALSGDLNTFLRLLTTQVTNQDPLEPTDSTQFVEQLATFSALEQQVASNGHLEAITSLLQASGGQTGTEYIGQLAQSSDIDVTGAFASLDIVSSAERGELVIRDGDGREVFRSPSGSAWSWDGKTASGDQVEDGRYFAEIETAGGTVDAVFQGTVDRVITSLGGTAVGLGQNVSARLA